MSNVSFHFANKDDVTGILEIYTPFILDSHTSFEEKVPSVDEMWNRINNILQKDAWLVAKDSNRVLGYAYASVFRARKAYDWVREVSVYLHPSAYSKGIGGQLYERLFAIMKLQGYRKLIAGVALPNDSSIQFHEKLGFQHFANFEEVGYKFDQWVTVGFWEKNLFEEKEVNPIKGIKEINLNDVEAILLGGNKNE